MSTLLEEAKDLDENDLDEWVDVADFKFDKKRLDQIRNKKYLLRINNDINPALWDEIGKSLKKVVQYDDKHKCVLIDIVNPYYMDDKYLLERAVSSSIQAKLVLLNVGRLKFFAQMGPPVKDNVSGSMMLSILNTNKMKKRLHQLQQELVSGGKLVEKDCEEDENYTIRRLEIKREPHTDTEELSDDDIVEKKDNSSDQSQIPEELEHGEVSSFKQVSDESMQQKDDDDHENDVSQKNEKVSINGYENNKDTEDSEEKIDITKTHVNDKEDDVSFRPSDLYNFYESYNPDWHTHNEGLVSFQNSPVSMSFKCGYQSMRGLIAYSNKVISYVELSSNLKIVPGSVKRFNTHASFINSRIYKVEWVSQSDTFMVSTSQGKIYVLNQGYTDDNKKGFDEKNLVSVNKNAKKNPVAVWNICKSAIMDFQFCPGRKYLATGSKDGYVRIFNYKQKRLEAMFKSYYGGITTLCWSPDGKLLLTGSEDDIISIWSFEEKKLIARCHGHTSWISKIVFDLKRTSSTAYRFLSVGQDCRCIIWEYSLESLNPPFLAFGDEVKDQLIVKKTKEDDDSSPYLQEENVSVLSKKEVFTIDPIKKIYVSPTPCSDIVFIDDDVFAITTWGGKMYSYIIVPDGPEICVLSDN